MTDLQSQVQRIEARFREIHSGAMADVPILNPALRVQALGFQNWQGGILGMLVTPWFINILYAFDPNLTRNTGESLPLGLPAGVFEFIVNQDRVLGTYAACSLFSPVLEFADQSAAVIAAQAALKTLMSEDAEAAFAAPETVADEPQAAAVGISRRQFFRGGREQL